MMLISRRRTNRSRRLAGLTSVVVSLLLFVTAQCKLASEPPECLEGFEGSKLVGTIEARRGCNSCNSLVIKKNFLDPGEYHCQTCSGHPGKSKKASKKASIYVVRNEGKCSEGKHPRKADCEKAATEAKGNERPCRWMNGGVKHLLFHRKTTGGSKTDYFTVAHVEEKGFQPHAEWMLLRLSGYGQVMRDRWVKIGKSLDFLKFLVKEDTVLKEDTIKVLSEKSDHFRLTGKSFVEEDSKSLIQAAIDYYLLGQSPSCSDCDGSGWIDAWFFGRGSSCTACSGTGHDISKLSINEGHWDVLTAFRRRRK